MGWSTAKASHPHPRDKKAQSSSPSIQDGLVQNNISSFQPPVSQTCFNSQEMNVQVGSGISKEGGAANPN